AGDRPPFVLGTGRIVEGHDDDGLEQAFVLQFLSEWNDLRGVDLTTAVPIAGSVNLSDRDQVAGWHERQLDFGINFDHWITSRNQITSPGMTASFPIIL